jgi:hypothetical protein
MMNNNIRLTEKNYEVDNLRMLLLLFDNLKIIYIQKNLI